MKRLLACLPLIFLLGGGTAHAQIPLQYSRIAYSSSGINYADLFLAKEKGYFREEGLDPQFIQMSSSIAITAGIAGEVDGQASVGSAIRAILRGAPLRVVVVTLRRPLFWLVVRPEYRSIKDLKGRVLGISTVGGSQHTRAKGMLALGYTEVADRSLGSTTFPRCNGVAGRTRGTEMASAPYCNVTIACSATITPTDASRRDNAGVARSGRNTAK